jgi:hypothetical protein
VFLLAAIGGHALPQDLAPSGPGADAWAGLAPPGFDLKFDGPFTVNWDDPNQVLRASLLATNRGPKTWEMTGFRWRVFDDANPLHDVIERGSYVNVDAEAHLGLELQSNSISEVDISWRARSARNNGPFVEQANAMNVETRKCFAQIRVYFSDTETWQAPIIHECAF